jgi:hypothetical protein
MILRERRHRSIWALVLHRRLVLALWLLAAYLLILYGALRWGNPSPDRYPESD